MIAGAQGLLLSIGLAVRSRKSTAPLACLSILLGVLSVELLTNFAVSVNYTNRPGAIPFWILGSYLLIPSSLLLLARHSIHLPPWPHKYILLLYMPAAIEILTETIIWVMHISGAGVVQLQQVLPWFIFTEILPVTATVTVLIWWLFRVHKRAGKKTFLKEIRTGFRSAIFLPYALLVYYIVLSLLWLTEAFFQVAFFSILEQLLAASMIILGYVSFVRTDLFTRLSFAREKAGSPWIHNDDEVLQKLVRLFEADRLHCRSRLSVDDLARALHVPSRYVSYLVGTYLNTTTTGLINKHRVEEVIRRLEDPAYKNMTILALAFESGFNSKSAFNHVFKTHTGVSPSQYLRKKS